MPARIQREIKDGASRVRVGIKPEGRAPAREGSDHCDARRARGRHRDLGRVRPDSQRPGRHGLRLERRVARSARTSISSFVASRLLAKVAAMPFAPHRYKR